MQKCSQGHQAFKWCGQPLLNSRIHCGDFLLSACILFSGNNFAKIELFARMLQLKLPGSSFFNAVQKHYLVDAVRGAWEEQRGALLRSFEGEKLVVLGDGRNDSPGKIIL